jgi:hypothetical protein
VKGKTPSPAILVVMASGVVMLLASFLSFYKFSILGQSAQFTAWSSKLFFPVTIIPVVFGVVMAAHAGISSFAPQVKLPEKLLGFEWNQVYLVLGGQSAVMMLAFLFQNRDPLAISTGFWLMLLSSIGLLVGAVLRTREPAPTS